jgi:cytochrome P450
VKLKTGERLLMSVAMGNLDSAAFPDAAAFDLDRENKAHMTFNTGPHRCIGSHLARAEMVALFDEWLRRLPNVRMDPGGQATYRTGLSFAVTALPLIWTPSG